jgi:uncharacterized membrane protein
VRAESLHAIILLAAIVGVGLASFALAETVDPALQHDCSVNVFFSCSKVDQSGQTTILGVPDWSIGLGGFLVLLALDLPLYATWRPPFLYALTGIAAIGVGVSVYLAYIELFRIDALCPVCLSAYLANLIVFVCGLALIRKARARDPDAEEAPTGEPTPPADARAKSA